MQRRNTKSKVSLRLILLLHAGVFKLLVWQMWYCQKSSVCRSYDSAKKICVCKKVLQNCIYLWKTDVLVYIFEKHYNPSNSYTNKVQYVLVTWMEVKCVKKLKATTQQHFKCLIVFTLLVYPYKRLTDAKKTKSLCIEING